MKKILFFAFFLSSGLFYSNCDLNVTPPIPDALAWVDLLDTSVTAAQKAQIRAWATEGLNPVRMYETSKLYTNAAEFYQALNTSKSIFHRRVLLNDQVEIVPGISSGAYVANGLPRTLIAATPSNTTLDLPAAEAPNFVEARDTLLGQGTKIYRVIGGANSFPTGGYWVDVKPTNYAEIIGGTAVQPEWNGFNEIIEYTIPANGMKVWRGRAAAQPIAGSTNKYVTTYASKYRLAGGGQQLYVPNVYRDFRDTAVYNSFLRNITKRDTILWKKN